MVCFLTIIGWDYTLDAAAQWAAGKKGEEPDVILVNGTCDLSSVDFDTGTINRNKAMLKCLREIRLSRPESRIVILLPPEKEECKDFFIGLVSLGIYDIYILNEFSTNDMQKWLKDKKTLVDVQHMLPNVETVVRDEKQSINVNFKSNKQSEHKKLKTIPWAMKPVTGYWLYLGRHY